MKILILGSEGFIGSHCIAYFLKKNYDVFGCDLLDYKSQNYNYTKISRLTPDFNELFNHNSYDLCINAAGNGSVPISINHPLADFEANCFDVIRLLELIKAKSPSCKYLHISSAAIYGNPRDLPVKENGAFLPHSPYGWHKLISENICKEYSILYNIKISIARPFSVFGPGLRKQLFWDLFKKIENDEIELWGDGTESRDFIYIEDLVKAFELILTKQTTNYEVYNIASGEETTISSVAEKFYQAIGSKKKYWFNKKSRPGDPKNWKADITKILDIGFKAEYGFDNALKTTIEWLKKQK